MPANYGQHTDGKLHTRHTELSKCETPSGMWQVVKDRMFPRPNSDTGVMAFGTERHDMLRDESMESGELPRSVQDHLPQYKGMRMIRCESEIAVEMFRDVVIHMQPDFYGELSGKRYLIDYKTTSKAGKSYYKKSHQLPLYTLIFMTALNEPVDYMVYVFELWDKERNNFIGYDFEEIPVTIQRLGHTKIWTKKMVQNLIKALSNAHLAQ